MLIFIIGDCLFGFSFLLPRRVQPTSRSAVRDLLSPNDTLNHWTKRAEKTTTTATSTPKSVNTKHIKGGMKRVFRHIKINRDREITCWFSPFFNYNFVAAAHKRYVWLSGFISRSRCHHSMNTLLLLQKKKKKKWSLYHLTTQFRFYLFVFIDSSISTGFCTQHSFKIAREIHFSFGCDFV